MLVRTSAEARTTHLQWQIDPILTYCEQEIPPKSVWRSRSGPVNCMECIKTQTRVRKGGDPPNQRDEQLVLYED